MKDDELIKSAKKSLMILIGVNFFMAAVVFIVMCFSNDLKTVLYSMTFFFVELMFIVFWFIPVTIYFLIKGNKLKLALAKAQLSYGDFYRNW